MLPAAPWEVVQPLLHHLPAALQKEAWKRSRTCAAALRRLVAGGALPAVGDLVASWSRASPGQRDISRWILEQWAEWARWLKGVPPVVGAALRPLGPSGAGYGNPFPGEHEGLVDSRGCPRLFRRAGAPPLVEELGLPPVNAEPGGILAVCHGLADYLLKANTRMLR